MGIVIILLVTVAIIAIALVIGTQRGKKLLAEGKIIRRQGAFGKAQNTLQQQQLIVPLRIA